jgi:hypothetical protein
MKVKDAAETTDAVFDTIRQVNDQLTRVARDFLSATPGTDGDPQSAVTLSTQRPESVDRLVARVYGCRGRWSSGLLFRRCRRCAAVRCVWLGR